MGDNADRRIVRDKGAYVLKFLACLENLTTFPVPQKFVNGYEDNKHRLGKPLGRLPPYLQALYLEEERLEKSIIQFPSTGNDKEKLLLETRLLGVRATKNMCLVDIFPYDEFERDKDIDFLLDSDWNAYKEKLP